MDDGRLFREAWINGVRVHYPGVPKPGYVAPWEDTPSWERECAAAVASQLREFLMSTRMAASRLTREQKGQFVAVCWTAQIYMHNADPKPGYVAPWEELPQWQRETDADIFEHIESVVEQRSLTPPHVRLGK